MRVHPGSSSPNGVDGVATSGSDVASASVANGSNGCSAVATNGNGDLRTAPAAAVAPSVVAVEADLFRKKVRPYFTKVI